MRTQSLLLMSLLGVLAGCQPEAPGPQDSAAPVMVAPVASPVSEVPSVASEVTPSAPVEQVSEAGKEKVAAAVKQKEAAKPALVAKPVAATSAQAAAPVVAEVKPEVKVVAAPSEADSLALAKKSGCLICHAVDRKIVGPAWKEVAAKYRGDAGAEARLMDKVAKGGSGAWGAVQMPAQSKVSETDRRSLVRFVLSLK